MDDNGVIYYMGKPIEDYTKESLIDIIQTLYHQLEGTRDAMRTLNEFSELRRPRFG